ncbi:MAG: hypothetical protein A3K19_01545 [Lentisphaerae bacterium RIFOXYB12_FULL_65_16]|nr:MAG: hypothetical protein A3K18_22900 [Lentisphaerae bacterium RIFOXYA12_64_32]OGV92824.1 MAG: hypothetical protein A3K19_01545 [Lentisphaerae bacterium RIFOXYB12_FULL_65_16]
MITSQLTSKGQTTIPLAVRRALRLNPRDRLVYELVGDGVTLHPLRGTLFDHRDSVKPRQHPEDFGAVRRTVKRRIAARVAQEA